MPSGVTKCSCKYSVILSTRMSSSSLSVHPLLTTVACTVISGVSKVVAEILSSCYTLRNGGQQVTTNLLSQIQAQYLTKSWLIITGFQEISPTLSSSAPSGNINWIFSNDLYFIL